MTDSDSTDEEDQRLRLVIQNQAESPETVRANLTTKEGTTILRESKEIQPNGGWIVTTLNVSSYDDEVIEFTITLPERNQTLRAADIRAEDSLERGARKYTIDQTSIDIYECRESVDCWETGG